MLLIQTLRIQIKWCYNEIVILTISKKFSKDQSIKENIYRFQRIKVVE